MAEVVLERVSKVFPGQVRAVHDLDLAVVDHELVVLVGPSGCGKTTVLRLIAGLEKASSGEIRIGGRVVNGMSPRDRNIAMVFQDTALYPHLTVFRNMGFGLQLRRRTGRLFRACEREGAGGLGRERPEAIRRRVHWAAETLGIEHLLDRAPGQLSGGERQRVALGRAIVRQPAAFLFDEPFSSLDAHLRVQIRRVFKQLHRQLRQAMLFVTHDQSEAIAFGDRIAVMNEGRVLQVGTPQEVCRRPCDLFVAKFLGVPAMNCIEGHWENRRGVPFFVGGGLAVDLSIVAPVGLARLQGRRLVMGVRPEDVDVAGVGSQGRSVVGEVAGLANGTGTLVARESGGDARCCFLTTRVLGEASEVVELVSKAQNLQVMKAIQIGANVTIRVNVSRLHVFDTLTGKNLN